jgi:hypothetical protein
MKLFLDDERFPPGTGEGWDIVRNMADATTYMRARGCPSFISFDHDLGEDQPTGYDLVNWMIERDLDENGRFIPVDFDFYVHSQNPTGRDNIILKLKAYLGQR